jgi:hypothetical protein
MLPLVAESMPNLSLLAENLALWLMGRCLDAARTVRQEYKMLAGVYTGAEKETLRMCARSFEPSRQLVSERSRAITYPKGSQSSVKPNA